MTDIPKAAGRKSSWIFAGLYALAIILGILNGCCPTGAGSALAKFFSEVFIRLFGFVSIPVIGVTICLTIASLGSSAASRSLWRRTLTYTLLTTALSAAVAAGLYLLASPGNYAPGPGTPAPDTPRQVLSNGTDYLDHIISVIPGNILSPVVNGSVLSVLLIAIATGIAIRFIRNGEHQRAVKSLLGGIQDILFIFISWIIKALPLGIFGFVSVCVADYRASGSGLGSLLTYFSVVVGANLIQGLLVLPLFLLVKRLNPLRIMKGMSKALLVAFFSKSSAGTLPVTMECAEKENGIHPRVSRFVLPVCTTINMNGCAAFILITVVYLMQNNGTPVTPLLLLSWIFIATAAAVGNAGVPMGCFFLSASLLASMGVPLELLGVILPVYAVIDMVETALNVWSDSCVAAAVNKDLGARLEELPEAGSPGEKAGEQAG